MDLRAALKKGTILRLRLKDSVFAEFEIQGEIGRGASCIVYDASYTDHAGLANLVRIKECYPFGLRIVRKGQALFAEPEAEAEFTKCLERTKNAFQVSRELFYTSGLTNFVSNLLDIYEANRTVYIISAYAEGKTLADTRFSSLKNKITAVRNTAEAVRKIHQKGYLYLDIKPENILVLEETAGRIQLYDFDSLVPMESLRPDAPDEKLRIAYTKGFAAVEQQLGRQEKMGKHTDVYGIGALLFFLLFHRTPRVDDCDWYAKYDYSALSSGNQQYADKLFFTLTDFFHHTLSDYYPDRYSDMSLAVSALDEAARCADTMLPYLCSTQFNSVERLFGREKEWACLENWRKQTDSGCLFITGMGGIGKSALARKYLSVHGSDFDSVLYLYYRESILLTLADDDRVRINTVERSQEESMRDYGMRKLQVLKKILSGHSAAIVIDDFDGEIDEDFLRFLDGGWKTLVLTRNRRLSDSYDSLEIRRIDERRTLYAFFEYYCGRSVEAGDEKYLNRLIECVAGHTLALKLIARQVACSYLSIEEACKLAEKNGFSAMAPEKVDGQRDQVTYRDTICHIIKALFHADELSVQEQVIMKTLALFDSSGVETHRFAGMLALDSRDDINSLRERGMLCFEKERFSLHPVIRESVFQLEWNGETRKAAVMVMAYLRERLAEESGNCLAAAQEVLRVCGKDPVLSAESGYRKLLRDTLFQAPSEEENFILGYAGKLLETPAVMSPEEKLGLLDRIVSIYDQRGDFEMAYHKIQEAKQIAKEADSHAAKAKYFEILADYYDACLDGCYAEGKRSKVYRLSLHALERAIFHIRKSQAEEKRELLIRYLLSELMFIIRSYPEKKMKLRCLLAELREAIGKEGISDTWLRAGVHMTRAWYFTLVCPDFGKTEDNMKRADLTVKGKKRRGLEFLDNIVIPCANMYVEWGSFEKSRGWLQTGIRLCEDREELLPFQRKKRELQAHIQEVQQIEQSLRTGGLHS